MNEVTLHPTPTWKDVLLEQLRIVGLGLRREALVVATVLVIVTVVILIDIVRGSAETWFDSDDWAPIAIFSFLFPFAVWRGEKPFGGGFLWTLPVPRRVLALTKVLAGGIWLISGLILLFVWQSVLAMVSRVAGAETIPLESFVGVTTLYLVGSALVLGLRHPLRWLLGTAAVLVLLGRTTEALGVTLLPRFWSVPMLFWLAAAAVALWVAASRHHERRAQ